MRLIIGSKGLLRSSFHAAIALCLAGPAWGLIFLWTPSDGWAGALPARAADLPALAQEGANEKPPALQRKSEEPLVLYDDGLLTVKAEKSKLLTVLERIAAATGIGLVKNFRVNSLVTVSFEKQPLAAGVEAVLKASGNKRYAAVYEKHEDQLKLVKVVLVNRGAREMSTIPWPAGVEREEASVERYLKQLLGTDTRVRVDERMRLPVSVKFYDPGASKRTTRENIREYAEELFKKVGPIFALDFSQLKFRAITEEQCCLNIAYDQVFQGVPVGKGAAFGLRVYKKPSDEPKPDIVSIGGYFRPDIDLSTKPTIDQESAVLIAKQDYKANWKSVYPEYKSYSEVPEEDKSLKSGIELLILPVEAKDDRPGPFMGYDYYLCWKFWFGKFIYYVDAHQGIVIQRQPTWTTIVSGLVRTKIFGNLMSGTVIDKFVDTGVVATDIITGNPVLKPLVGIQVTWKGGQPVWTAVDGSFSFSGTADPTDPGEVRSFLDTGDASPWVKEHLLDAIDPVSLISTDLAPSQEYEASDGNAFWQAMRGIGDRGLLRSDIAGPDLTHEGRSR